MSKDRMRAVVERCERMPFEPSAACPVCGDPLDPLRAPLALAFDDGMVLVCKPECGMAVRNARKQGRRTTPAAGVPTPGMGLRGEELTQLHQINPVPVAPPMRAPLVSSVLVVGSAALSLVPSTGSRVVALALLTSTIGASAFSYRRERAETPFLVLQLAGILLLCVASVLDGLAPRYLLAAAAATLLGALRPWLAVRGRGPVQRLASGLLAALPGETRVPLDEVEDAGSAPWRMVSARRIHSGDVVLVEEGETLMVDGVLQTGRVTLLPTAASLTPEVRVTGQPVLAGARVLRGSASVLATRVGNARALARAALSPTRRGRMALWGDVAARPLTALAYAALGALLAWASASELTSALGALGVVLVGYPLLSLRVGLDLYGYAARVCAAQQGMVFRDAETMEDAGHISALALMADGTVTDPERIVTELLVYGRDLGREELVSLAMGLEASCETHPIAQAIAVYGEQHACQPRAVRRAAHAPGRGITALAPGGEALAIGNRPLLLSAGVSVAVAERDAQAAEAAGRSAVFLAVDGRVRALFVLDYQLRPQARGALQAMIDLGADVALLSGDHRATVESFAARLDITHVKAELHRDERAAEVARLREAGGLVAVIGRLPDDEGALAEADVAVALNGAGAAAADIELALATDDIADAARALGIAHATYRRQRLVVIVSVAACLATGLAALLSLGPPALWPLAVLAVESWTVSPGGALLARLRGVGIVGSERPVSPRSGAGVR